ncbi:hypothetical protein [Comamonas suwonensis]|uniref:DUF3102 domain-containing protein n=1 Tax=Comamonas suwonensis TaxID=2606214 RepID=A0A843BAU0_9BURK|nr:hypothetical protein [Comamonas suwonensis]MBI1626975.1 hypothetical protein [Comamonas suwonensis]
MSRIATKTQETVTDVVLDKNAVARIEQAQDAMAIQAQEASTQAKTMALQVGYDGTLSVGALEDEIRFYQKRTVEAILETGKRLLVLKELTPHGEFQQRVELLGFAKTTAFRFMQAAAKTAKSSKLELLSTHVKSASAFLELVTHDDDTLESLKDMDDIERMSASELRATLRQAKEDNKFIAEKRDKESERADRAEKTLASGGPRSAPVSERLADFEEQVGKAQEAASKALLEITKQLGALNDWWSEEMTQQPGYEPGDAVPTPPEVVELAQKMHDHIERIAASVGGLQRQIWENHGHDIQAARTYVMQPGVIPGHAGQAEVE